MLRRFPGRERSASVRSPGSRREKPGPPIVRPPCADSAPYRLSRRFQVELGLVRVFVIEVAINIPFSFRGRGAMVASQFGTILSRHKSILRLAGSARSAYLTAVDDTIALYSHRCHFAAHLQHYSVRATTPARGVGNRSADRRRIR